MATISGLCLLFRHALVIDVTCQLITIALSHPPAIFVACNEVMFKRRHFVYLGTTVALSTTSPHIKLINFSRFFCS